MSGFEASAEELAALILLRHPLFLRSVESECLFLIFQVLNDDFTAFLHKVGVVQLPVLDQFVPLIDEGVNGLTLVDPLDHGVICLSDLCKYTELQLHQNSVDQHHHAWRTSFSSQ